MLVFMFVHAALAQKFTFSLVRLYKARRSNPSTTMHWPSSAQDIYTGIHAEEIFIV
jgi:hypothetical protein